MKTVRKISIPSLAVLSALTAPYQAAGSAYASYKSIEEDNAVLVNRGTKVRKFCGMVP